MCHNHVITLGVFEQVKPFDKTNIPPVMRYGQFDYLQGAGDRLYVFNIPQVDAKAIAKHLGVPSFCWGKPEEIGVTSEEILNAAKVPTNKAAFERSFDEDFMFMDRGMKRREAYKKNG